MSLTPMPVRRRTYGALVAWLAASMSVSAIFMTPEIRQVPVARLLDNLERRLKEEPRNITTIVNIARLHAMAYALKGEELPAVAIAKDAVETAYYPPGSGVAPPAVKEAVSREQAVRAAQHLRDAIRHYESALALDPENLTARLGHGWALQQSGDARAAIADYRAVVKSGWATEQNVKRLTPGQRLFTQEAIEYLLPLLDANADAAEIAELRARQEAIASKPRAITPIAIPLADDLPAHALLDPGARVRFDADGSALDRKWTWITAHAAWLVYDADGKGTIESALQLFGNVTFWLFWENGYEALGALDDNGDGELAAAELDKLALWHDVNSNGRTDPREVQPLAAYDIIALSCDYLNGDGWLHAAMSPRGVRFSDGRTRPSYDLILRDAATRMTRITGASGDSRQSASRDSKIRDNPRPVTSKEIRAIRVP